MQYTELLTVIQNCSRRIFNCLSIIFTSSTLPNYSINKNSRTELPICARALDPAYRRKPSTIRSTSGRPASLQYRPAPSTQRPFYSPGNHATAALYSSAPSQCPLYARRISPPQPRRGEICRPSLAELLAARRENDVESQQSQSQRWPWRHSGSRAARQSASARRHRRCKRSCQQYRERRSGQQRVPPLGEDDSNLRVDVTA